VLLDNFEVLHKVDCFDAHAVEKWNGIATVDVKKCSNNATNIGANFEDAFLPGYHPQTFNGSLQKFSIRFDKIEFALILGKLLHFTMRFDLSNIILTNKTQNRDQTHLKFQRVKRGTLNLC
jgi:hypothetical protein